MARRSNAYVPNDQNPYLDESASGGRRGRHFANAPANDEIEAYVPTATPRRRRSKKPLVFLLVLALLAAGGYVGWTRYGDKVSDLLMQLGIGGKTVTVTLDGEQTRIPVGSTVQSVYELKKPDVAAGDMLSVGGNVLGAGEGEAFAATLNGEEVAYADAASTQVKEGAQLSYADGADLTEDYTSSYEVTSKPKLVREVQEGASDTGVEVQQGVLQYVYQWGKEGRKETRTGSVSGETVDGEVIEGQDCIIMCQDIHPDNGEKLVALTFDDGPTAYTSQYLEILNKYGIKATFNLIGEQVEDYADVVKTNIANGNQICSHTWHHPDLTTLDEADLRTQLGDAFDVIKRVADYDTTTIRAPYGSINIDVWLKSGGAMTCSVCWSHDSRDWALPGVDQIVENCTAYMAPGSVILMHDGGGNRDQDLEAIPRIIEAWQNAGYKFVTVEELMASDSSIPEAAACNYVAMPEDAVWPTELAETPEA